MLTWLTGSLISCSMSRLPTYVIHLTHQLFRCLICKALKLNYYSSRVIIYLCALLKKLESLMRISTVKSKKQNESTLHIQNLF
jgi:superfamily II helicase